MGLLPNNGSQLQRTIVLFRALVMVGLAEKHLSIHSLASARLLGAPKPHLPVRRSAERLHPHRDFV
jgi:hypothetical protein